MMHLPGGLPHTNRAEWTRQWQAAGARITAALPGAQLTGWDDVAQMLHFSGPGAQTWSCPAALALGARPTSPVLLDACLTSLPGRSIQTPIGPVVLHALRAADLPAVLLEKVVAWFLIAGSDLFLPARTLAGWSAICPPPPDPASLFQARRQAERYAQSFVDPRFRFLVLVAPVWRGLVIGMARLLPQSSGRANANETDTFVLQDLVVDPGLRRAGLGSILVRAGAQVAAESGASTLLAHIETHNTASLHLHARLGFLPATHLLGKQWYHLPLSPFPFSEDPHVHP